MGDNFITAETVLYALSLAVQLCSIITIGRYDPAHNSGPMLCPTLFDYRSWNASWQTCNELKVLMPIILSPSADFPRQNYPSRLASYAFEDPSPAAFDSALVMFTLAVLYLHTTDGDGYQTRCLLLGTAAAAVISSTRWFLLSDESLAQSIQMCLPIMVTLSSVIGISTHRMGSRAASRGKIHEWQQRKEPLDETTKIRRVAGSMKQTERQGNKGETHKQDSKENGCPEYLEN